MRQQPILKATFIVTLFWWVVLTLWEAGFNLRDLIRDGKGLDWDWSLSVLVALAGGVFCGVFYQAYSIWFDRKESSLKLIGRMQYGIRCTIGAVPMHHYDLRTENSEITPISRQLVEAVSEIRADRTADFLEKWHDRFDKHFPAHAALMYGIETILMQYLSLPATHVPGGHGGRSLLDHSLLVSWYMDKLAPHHSYNGKIKLPEFSITLPLRRSDYTFDSNDPLITLIGLAHDVGKIECYEFDSNGKVIDCRADHDLTGARIVARMPEYWELPPNDREVLHDVMAFYHHPQDVPTEDGYMVRDDRIHALLELLIRADTLASRREAGINASNAMAELADLANPHIEAVETEKTEKLWEAVHTALLPDQFNRPAGSASIGFKAFHPHLHKTFLFLIEKELVDAVCSITGLENNIQKTANPVGPVTKALLRLFDEKGCLYSEQEAGGRNVESSLYRISFFDRKEFWQDKEERTPKPAEKRGTPKFSLGSCIVVECDPHFATLINVADYHLVPVIGASRLGNQGKRKAAPDTIEDQIVHEQLGLATQQDDRPDVLTAKIDKQILEKQEKEKAKQARQAQQNAPAVQPVAPLTLVPAAAPTPVQPEKPAVVSISEDEWSESAPAASAQPTPQELAAADSCEAPQETTQEEENVSEETDSPEKPPAAADQPVTQADELEAPHDGDNVIAIDNYRMLINHPKLIIHTVLIRAIMQNHIKAISKPKPEDEAKGTGEYAILMTDLDAWLLQSYNEEVRNTVMRTIEAKAANKCRASGSILFVAHR